MYEANDDEAGRENWRVQKREMTPADRKKFEQIKRLRKLIRTPTPEEHPAHLTKRGRGMFPATSAVAVGDDTSNTYPLSGAGTASVSAGKDVAGRATGTLSENKTVGANSAGESTIGDATSATIGVGSVGNAINTDNGGISTTGGKADYAEFAWYWNHRASQAWKPATNKNTIT